MKQFSKSKHMNTQAQFKKKQNTRFPHIVTDNTQDNSSGVTWYFTLDITADS